MYYCDLATERERQFRTGKHVKKTEHDFWCSICRSAICDWSSRVFDLCTQLSLLSSSLLPLLNLPNICARGVQLAFPSPGIRNGISSLVRPLFKPRPTWISYSILLTYFMVTIFCIHTLSRWGRNYCHNFLNLI